MFIPSVFGSKTRTVGRPRKEAKHTYLWPGENPLQRPQQKKKDALTVLWKYFHLHDKGGVSLVPRLLVGREKTHREPGYEARVGSPRSESASQFAIHFWTVG